MGMSISEINTKKGCANITNKGALAFTPPSPVACAMIFNEMVLTHPKCKYLTKTNAIYID
jgi:hypothetical protein